MRNNYCKRVAAAAALVLSVTAHSYAAENVQSPDGTTWIVQIAADRILRQAPGEVPTVALQLSAGAKPAAIVADPDGSLWFSEQGRRRIARYRPVDKVMQEFLAGEAPYGIALAPNGDVWVTQADGKQVGHLSGPERSYTAVTLGDGWCCKAFDIRVGDDGNLWLNDEMGRQFAYVNPATPLLVQAAPDARRAFPQAAGNAVFDFADDAFEANELCGSAKIEVHRTGDLSTAVTIKFATTDGTAKAFEDYDSRSGELQFAANESSKTFLINIHDGGGRESIEDVQLTLSEPSAGAMLGSRSSAIIQIFDATRLEGFGSDCSTDRQDGNKDSGGCTIGGAQSTDPILPLAALSSAALITWRWRRSRQQPRK
jgi:Calx-beta domain